MRGFSCGREHVGFYLESPLIFISFSRSMVAIKGGRDVAGTDDYIYIIIQCEIQYGFLTMIRMFCSMNTEWVSLYHVHAKRQTLIIFGTCMMN